MNGIKESLYGLCALILLCDIGRALFADDRRKRMIRYAFGILLLSMTIIIIRGTSFSFDESYDFSETPEIYDMQSKVEEVELRQVGSMAEEKIKDLLENHMLSVDAVEVLVHKEDDGSIWITEVIVTSSEDHESIEKIVTEAAGDDIICTVHQ